MFHRKWHWILVSLLVLSIAGVGFFRTRTSQKPIKTYKIVTSETPATTQTKPSVQHGHDTDQPHADLPHSHTSHDQTDSQRR